MTLTISENWIRERIQLDHENADDVRSLALPGTYHEKITHLGNSLLSFSRLKHLDISRNALQSLDGLNHLNIVNKINLYYNNIATLKELYKLRYNTQLEEVDLRLNPVTKNEPDYRLFMVHMLPNLRKLDDRSIRDSERKAALMHFNTDQASEFTEHPAQIRQMTSSDKQSVPRADYVTEMAKKTSALDDDDCEILDMIARTGNLSMPQPMTGSTAVYPQATTHSLTDIRQMEQAANHAGMSNSGNAQSMSPSRRSAKPYGEQVSSPTRASYGTQRVPNVNGISHGTDSDEELEQLGIMPNGAMTTPSRYFQLSTIGYNSPPTPPTPEMLEIAPGILTPSPDHSPTVPVYGRYAVFRGTQPTAQPMTQSPTRQAPLGRDNIRVQFADAVESRSVERSDTNLHYTDESKAYTAYTSRGNFTAHPGLSGSGSQANIQQQAVSRNQEISTLSTAVSSKSSNQNSASVTYGVQSSTESFSEPPPLQRVTETRDRGELVQEDGLNQQQFMDKFLNVVDRYWNGSKSLHNHVKFQGQAQGLVSNLLSEVLSTTRQETDRLHEDVARFAQETVALRNQLGNQRSASNASAKSQIDQTKIQLSLEQAQQDVGALKHQLHLSMQENQRFQEQLNSVPQTTLPPVPQHNSHTQQVDQEMLRTLETEVECLQRDNVTLKLQLKHFTQLQELASMLQQSHKSLVTTNDHLLKELDEGKQRHAEEVKQLHWSYGELKRTMELNTGNSALSGSSGRNRMSGGANSLKLQNGVY